MKLVSLTPNTNIIVLLDHPARSVSNGTARSLGPLLCLIFCQGISNGTCKDSLMVKLAYEYEPCMQI